MELVSIEGNQETFEVKFNYRSGGSMTVCMRDLTEYRWALKQFQGPKQTPEEFLNEKDARTKVVPFKRKWNMKI